MASFFFLAFLVARVAGFMWLEDIPRVTTRKQVVPKRSMLGCGDKASGSSVLCGTLLTLKEATGTVCSLGLTLSQQLLCRAQLPFI